jgi:hypothetical protein
MSVFLAQSTVGETEYRNHPNRLTMFDGQTSQCRHRKETKRGGLFAWLLMATASLGKIYSPQWDFGQSTDTDLT